MQPPVTSSEWSAAGERARSAECAQDLGIVAGASVLGIATALGLAEPETVAALADLALSVARALPFIG
jgi:hypothetical protein